MRDLFLGVDIGTSYSKGVLVLSDGTVVASAERPHDVSIPRPGWAEQDSIEVWWRDFLYLCAQLIPLAGGRVAGVATSGLGPTVLLVDAAGTPLRPAILYGVDTRAVAEIGEQTRRYGAAEILARGGSALTSQSVGPKLEWLRLHEPSTWARASRFLMVQSYLVHRLTGEYVLDHHAASQCGPLYDVIENRWIPERCAEIAPGLEFPRLAWANEVAGMVSRQAADETGIPAGTPVAVGTIDAWAEATSVGVRQPGDAMLMYGTALTLVEMVAPLKPVPAMWGVVGAFPGTWSLAGGVTTSGALTKWFRALLGDPPFEALFAEAARVPAGCRGLLVLPYFSGERNPFFDPDARGVMCGLTLVHDRAHVFRALLEGPAFAVRHMLDALDEEGVRPERIVAVGGGTHHPLWPQIVSDVIGKAQAVPRVTIGAAFGDAFLAGVASGRVDPEANWNSVARMVQPDTRNETLYGELYGLFRDLHGATVRHQHALSRLSAATASPDPG